ncbi:BTB/POZ domain-containing protein At2g04740 isoform X1 [Juglans microcarpa x Juglans regia]|uniref:BTB/POZ domain-containing protein At2g04740 isoform X1 n=1 Tax=Juglans microcarpa x Juglans regia TaxID=2249226 RepID=UPI001B7F4D05|nr:BTB/POZ domain-containing protein At2g04740 isoform X1 [Juglans microcarpa x Juglans regia]
MASPTPDSSLTFTDTDLDGIDLDPSDFGSSIPLKKVPNGDVFEASRAGDIDRLKYLLELGINVNARDQWDSVALYYACLSGHLDAARMLLESGAICSEHTFDGDRCHYAALNLKVRKLLKAFEARPPPLGPLQASMREIFMGCGENRAFLEQANNQSHISALSSTGGSNSYHFPPDVVFFVQGRPIEAHRVILSARSSYFKRKFETDWKDRKEVRFAREKLSYTALYSLIHFFYSDRLEIVVDDMEDLVRICKVCKCESLQRILEKELIHQKYAEYKALKDIDDSQKRFILQGISLPEEDRLPASLHQILQIALANSTREQNQDNSVEELSFYAGAMQISDFVDDLADVSVQVDKKIFRCHQVVLASRSEYFRARLSRMKGFHEGKVSLPVDTLPCLEEHDLSTEAFEKMIEYMYTDGLKDIDPDQAEEMFDAASRYLLFPLKRAVADVLLPHLEMVSPAELCQWLILSDMYGVVKIREYCLDTIACNFETFADTREFRAMLLTLPPPSGDSSLRTTVPSAPGAIINADQANLLDDLREKWLEAEAAELDKRDESALLFDKRLEMLMLVAEQEKSDGAPADDFHGP